jgi:hypothetical protein
MTDAEKIDHLIGRIIEKFEARYGIRLTRLERDCLLRDFSIEADEIIDAAYSAGWDDCELYNDDEETAA